MLIFAFAVNNILKLTTTCLYNCSFIELCFFLFIRCNAMKSIVCDYSDKIYYSLMFYVRTLTTCSFLIYILVIIALLS